MKYLTKKMTIVINKLALKYAGGPDSGGNNIRPGQSLGFIDWIYQNTVFGEKMYPNIFHQAGAYMFYIIKNHIFIDGNKRTGLAAAVTFLQQNNIVFHSFDEDAVFDFVVSVASGENEPEIIIPKIAQWFQDMCVY